MFKSTVNELYTLHTNIANILQSAADTAVGKVSVALNFNYRIMSDALTEFMAERDKVIEKYGTKDETTGIYSLENDSENMEVALKEIKELGEIEVELPVMFITIDDLYKAADVLPSSNIGALIWMTKEYRETKKDKKD